MTLLSEIIIPWQKLALGEPVDQTNAFFKFIAIWIAFNGIYYVRYDGQEIGDWPKIRDFAKESDTLKRHKSLLKSDENYYQAVKCLAEKGVKDTRRLDEGPFKIKNPNDSSRVLRCVYQVRNNLFHSGKNLKNPRDKRLVEAAYTIVSGLIEPLLDPDTIDSWDKSSRSAYDIPELSD